MHLNNNIFYLLMNLIFSMLIMNFCNNKVTWYLLLYCFQIVTFGLVWHQSIIVIKKLWKRCLLSFRYIYAFKLQLYLDPLIRINEVLYVFLSTEAQIFNNPCIQMLSNILYLQLKVKHFLSVWCHPSLFTTLQIQLSTLNYIWSYRLAMLTQSN